MKRFLLFFLPALGLLPSQTFAQVNENAAVVGRMERLERDIQLLQRQLARGGASVSMPTPIGGADHPPPAEAQTEVRLSTIEEEIRSLRGKIEEVEFQSKKLIEIIEKFQKDTEFRFSELNSAKPPQSSSGTPEIPSSESMPKNAETPSPLEDHKSLENSNFSTPRDHYNYAFRLLNQTKYEEAAAAFESFIKKYPKDPLIGNAYYWQGETFYIRRDYVTAADSFRAGFEAMSSGPKAADNLLKLAMSLDALKRTKEACVVMSEVVVKFKKSSPGVSEKAEQERKRMGC